jgi:hypothetical protein
MTLIKSLLLGSTAGIVAVASAHAADLPTRKAAPVEYVRVCNVGGITGWTLPGSDTCVKFSGYITGQVTGGNLNTQFNWGTVNEAIGAINNTPGLAIATGPGSLLSNLAAIDNRNTQRVLLAASSPQQNTSFYRNETGWSTRANFGFDLASNTAYGPLIGHFDLNVDVSNGFDPLQGATPTPNIAYLNTGYVTWAGVTAGKAQSFYSFTGGGDNFANFFSPDRKGFNEPLLLAYTASFGGGFTATLSAESPGTVGASGGGTMQNGSYFNTNSGPQAGTFNPPLIQYGGQKWPDFVGALHVKQGWGEAQVSGVIHNVNVSASTNGVLLNPDVDGPSCGSLVLVACNSERNQIGWGVDAGLKLNLTNGGWFGNFWGAGDDFLVTGSFTRSATWYSGLSDGMWSENGQVNGNGQPMELADAFFNPLTNSWSQPTAWSISALLEHHFTPQFYIDLEGSVGGVKWSNQGGGCNFALPSCLLGQAAQGPLSPSAFSWIIGADLGWNPATNLNFDLELMYQSTNQAAPSGFIGTVYNSGQSNEFFVPGNWRGISDGFAGRFRVTRYF